MSLSHSEAARNPCGKLPDHAAARLAAIRSAIADIQAQPGRSFIVRKQRDETILHCFAADAWAKLHHARAAQ